ATIAIIPDELKQQVYARRIAQMMDIEENRMYDSIQRFRNRRLNDLNKRVEKDEFKDTKLFEVIRNDFDDRKVDVQYVLERKIIEVLLLYGNKTEDFEDLVLKENEQGQLVLEPVINTAKVFEKVFLDLQDDEMEFSNPHFKTLYYTIIDTLNQNPDFQLKNFINTVDTDIANEITTILMEDERYSLDDWERMHIFPKGKSSSIAQLVSETILSLRCFLIDQKVKEFQQKTIQNKAEVNKNILEEVKDYSGLKMLLSRKLNRAL
ncbi:MAG: DNA primase, partial [Flavobacteriales bacterium]|nr:DNA primase [Flavobacteriales bacterium]